MPVLMSNYVMLQRNLIYTGITRKKRYSSCLAKKVLAYAVGNVAVKKRYTLLKERLSVVVWLLRYIYILSLIFLSLSLTERLSEDCIHIWSESVQFFLSVTVLTVYFLSGFFLLHNCYYSFRFTQGTNKTWKSLLCLSFTLFIIVLGIAIHYRARKEKWRIYFDPV